MKTIFKRVSKSTLAIVLTICMLISCMTAAMIATDAARVTDSSEAVAAKADSEVVGSSITGITKAFVYGSFASDGGWSSSWETYAMSGDGNHYELDLYLKENITFSFKIIAGGSDWEHKYSVMRLNPLMYMTATARLTKPNMYLMKSHMKACLFQHRYTSSLHMTVLSKPAEAVLTPPICR